MTWTAGAGSCTSTRRAACRHPHRAPSSSPCFNRSSPRSARWSSTASSSVSASTVAWLRHAVRSRPHVSTGRGRRAAPGRRGHTPSRRHHMFTGFRRTDTASARSRLACPLLPRTGRRSSAIAAGRTCTSCSRLRRTRSRIVADPLRDHGQHGAELTGRPRAYRPGDRRLTGQPDVRVFAPNWRVAHTGRRVSRLERKRS